MDSPAFSASVPKISFDGLITNDKFCWIRQYRLTLSWSEAQLRQAAEFSQCSDSLQALEETVALEIASEAAVDIKRQFKKTLDGQHRWDQAYQFFP